MSTSEKNKRLSDAVMLLKQEARPLEDMIKTFGLTEYNYDIITCDYLVPEPTVISFWFRKRGSVRKAKALFKTLNEHIKDRSDFDCELAFNRYGEYEVYSEIPTYCVSYGKRVPIGYCLKTDGIYIRIEIGIMANR